MYESRYQHAWWVPEKGHKWADMWRVDFGKAGPVHSGPHRYLMTAAPRGQARIYKPLEEHSGLCMEFAQLVESEDAIRAFADRFGMLGVVDSVVASEKGGALLEGETFARWVSEIRDMREAADLLRAVQAGRHADLKRVIRWHSKGGQRWVSFENERRHAVIAAPDHHPAVFAMLRWGELVKPALATIQAAANAKLKTHASPAMMWDSDNVIGLYFRPENLLGALWLQFALAVSQNSEFRECEHCGKPFEAAAPGASRKDKRFCSTSCRVMASRARRREKDHAQT